MKIYKIVLTQHGTGHCDLCGKQSDLVKYKVYSTKSDYMFRAFKGCQHELLCDKCLNLMLKQLRANGKSCRPED